MSTRPFSLSRSNRSRLVQCLVAFGVVGLLALSSPADARLGGGGSFGSRGTRTFSMPSATPTAPRISPIQRSETPFNGGFSSPGFARPGFFGGGFGRGLLGGFLGAGLFGLLFGQGFFGGLGGGLSLFGLLLQVGLLFLLIRFAMGFFRGQQTAFGGATPFGGQRTAFGGGGGSGFNPARPRSTPIAVTPDDYQTFEKRLVEAQAAYTDRNVDRLSRLATPEMVRHFSSELSASASRGEYNRISDVRLIQGDLAEAWREANAEYASVAMRFSLIDVTTDERSGRVVAGNPAMAQTVTEVWTFVRPSGSGPQAWMLSAIQQG